MGVNPVLLALKASMKTPNGSRTLNRFLLALEASDPDPVSPSAHVNYHVIKFQIHNRGTRIAATHPLLSPIFLFRTKVIHYYTTHMEVSVIIGELGIPEGCQSRGQ